MCGCRASSSGIAAASRPCAFNPDGQRVLATPPLTTLRTSATRSTSQPVGDASPTPVLDLRAAFSSDGRRVVTASVDRTACLGRGERPHRRPSPTRPAARCQPAAFSRRRTPRRSQRLPTTTRTRVGAHDSGQPSAIAVSSIRNRVTAAPSVPTGVAFTVSFTSRALGRRHRRASSARSTPTRTEWQTIRRPPQCRRESRRHGRSQLLCREPTPPPPPPCGSGMPPPAGRGPHPPPRRSRLCGIRSVSTAAASSLQPATAARSGISRRASTSACPCRTRTSSGRCLQSRWPPRHHRLARQDRRVLGNRHPPGASRRVPALPSCVDGRGLQCQQAPRVVTVRQDGSRAFGTRLLDSASAAGPPRHQSPGLRGPRNSPDGRRRGDCLRGQDRARLGRRHSGHPVGAPLQHLGQCRGGAFSPDGRASYRLARTNRAASGDAAPASPSAPSCSTWASQLGRLQPRRCGSVVTSAEFSTTSAYAAQIWDAATGQSRRRARRNTRARSFGRVQPETGAAVVTASEDNTRASGTPHPVSRLAHRSCTRGPVAVGRVQSGRAPRRRPPPAMTALRAYGMSPRGQPSARPSQHQVSVSSGRRVQSRRAPHRHRLQDKTARGLGCRHRPACGCTAAAREGAACGRASVPTGASSRRPAANSACVGRRHRRARRREPFNTEDWSPRPRSAPTGGAS